MTEPTLDRRRHLRVNLRSHGTLHTADGACPAHLLDISPSGALIAVLEPHQLAVGEAVRIDIEMPGGDTATMEGHIAHLKEHLMGLDCTASTEKDAARLKEVTELLARDQA